MYLITWSLLIYQPLTLRDGRLSWPCWLTESGRLNRQVITHPASSLAQDRGSSPAENSVLTMLRRQLGLGVTQGQRNKTTIHSEDITVARAIFSGFTPLKTLTSTILTLFQHISAVAVVNIVTILSRSVGFSFHLKHFVTQNKCWKGVWGLGSTLDVAGEHDAPPGP